MSANSHSQAAPAANPTDVLPQSKPHFSEASWAKVIAARLEKSRELLSAERLLSRGDIDAALAAFQRIRQAALRSRDWLLAEVASQHLANGYRQLGDPANASIWQQQSIAHRVRCSPPAARSTDVDLARLACELTNLGSDAFRRNELNLAETYWRRALAIEEWRGDWEGQALDIGNLGLLAAARGDFELGIRRLRQSLRLHRLMFDELHAGIDLVNLAELHRLSGDLRQSLQALKNAAQRFAHIEAAHWLEVTKSRRQEIERILQLRSLDPSRN